MLFSISFNALQKLHRDLQDPTPSGCIIFDIYPVLFFLGLIIIPIVLIIFKNPLRKKVRIVRILLLIFGILLLFLVGNLFYLENQFKMSQLPSNYCEYRFLTHILVNVASLGMEMFLLGVPQRRKTVRDNEEKEMGKKD